MIRQSLYDPWLSLVLISMMSSPSKFKSVLYNATDATKKLNRQMQTSKLRLRNLNLIHDNIDYIYINQPYDYKQHGNIQKYWLHRSKSYLGRLLNSNKSKANHTLISTETANALLWSYILQLI